MQLSRKHRHMLFCFVAVLTLLSLYESQEVQITATKDFEPTTCCFFLIHRVFILKYAQCKSMSFSSFFARCFCPKTSITRVDFMGFISLFEFTFVEYVKNMAVIESLKHLASNTVHTALQ